MILVRSPLRISLGGGGTDLPSYYEKFEGQVLSAAINKYVYIGVMRPFSQGIFLKYSKTESVTEVYKVEHPIVREVLSELDLATPQIEITSLADIPAGTGLGSSGSFTTALIKALYLHYKKSISPDELAELASHIEINKLKNPIGKQDQYIAAIGGITKFDFKSNGTVQHQPLSLTNDTLVKLEDNLLLFFTGQSRSASKVLVDQQRKTIDNDDKMIENLHATKALGEKSMQALLNGDLNEFGYLMHEHWCNKRKRSESITNPFIESSYDVALKNGAIGGKLVGAGGGGFLMFYASDREKLKASMNKLDLPEVRFRFDFEGTKVLLSP